MPNNLLRLILPQLKNRLLQLFYFLCSVCIPYKKIMSMRNHQFYFAFCLLGASLWGCQKETVLVPGTSPATFTPTILSFTVGDRSYALDAVSQSDDEHGQVCQSSQGASYAPGGDLVADWTRYAVAGKFLTITRQQADASAALRLTLVGTIDLDAMTLPATVASAHLILADPAGSLTPSDDPAVNGRERTYDGVGDAVTLTITSKNGNAIQGTFSGVLTANGGANVEVREGRFQAQVVRQ